jgi:hypothetical protein
MTCHDARESLSAFLDEALAPDGRREVAAHLEGCPDCRRELARLEQTVALLRRVEPARAPVGFVDRVMEAARPRPWYRRAAAAVFVPFSVKLPAEATALVMVALLAVYVFERTPALRESVRQEPTARETPREKVATPATGLVGRPARVEPSRPPSAESPAAVRRQEPDRRDAGGAAPGVARPAPVAPDLDAAPAPPPAAPKSEQAPALSAPAPAAPRAGGELAKEAESRPAENRRPPAGSSADAARGAPAAPRLAAKRAAPSDAVAGIAVRDRDAAERDLAELIARVGGRETGRRREEEATVVEAVVPQARYAEFTQGLARLGAWRLQAERPDLPSQVHVTLRLQ